MKNKKTIYFSKKWQTAGGVSRRKIILGILLVALLFYVCICAAIYFASIMAVRSENESLIKMYAEYYETYGNPAENDGAVGQNPGHLPPETSGAMFMTDAYSVVSFASVFFGEDGTVQVDTGTTGSITREELVATASALTLKNKTFGSVHGDIYYVNQTEEGTLVVLMHNDLLTDTFLMFLKYTAVAGVVFFAVIFFLAPFLAGWMVRPLEVAMEKQRQFISDAGHELKTPVSSIKANAELAEKELGENRWLSNVQTEASRMSDMVGDLLELARLSRTETVMGELDLERMILGAVLPLEAEAFDKGHMLETRTEPVTIRGDQRQIEKLLDILVENAMRYGEPDTPILIELSAKKSVAQLSVTNTGQEIAKEDAERIFDRFVRLDEAREGEGGNYGLGLSIAKTIVSSHGSIRAKGEDGKNIFTVEFPAVL